MYQSSDVEFISLLSSDLQYGLFNILGIFITKLKMSGCGI